MDALTGDPRITVNPTVVTDLKTGATETLGVQRRSA
jgi:hypothetical protein